MRRIGSMADEKTARSFGDFLYASGIENNIEPAETTAGRDRQWDIWVHSDNLLDQAKALLAEFLAHPDDPKFKAASSLAGTKRKKEEQELKAYQKRFITGRQLFPQLERLGPVTTAHIGISVAVALVSALGSDRTLLRYLQISEYPAAFLPEVMRGQVWRLVTPIFIHYGLLHILFNMLWLRDLGSMVEQHQGRVTLFLLVSGIAVLSNLGQYVMSGPYFGGMSGVVYGLLGYCWIRGRFDPWSGLFVNQQTVLMMIIWFFVCLLGLVGAVANTAHAAGFAAGAGWGYVSARIALLKRTRSP